ncbi:MAG: DinB family protein [Deinococcales bacterium]
MMDFKTWLYQAVAWLAFERPAQWRSYGDMDFLLRGSSQTISQRLDNAADSEVNRKKLRHIIGIERWGQQRLRVLLGDNFQADEHYSYKPAENTSWQDLKETFIQTRQASLELVNQLRELNSNVKVPHNQLGPLSAKGWLRYLNLHATIESRGINA